MLHIRPAEPSDAAAISELVSALVTKFIAPDCSPSGAVILLNSMTTEAIAGYISQANFDYQLATLEGELVAVVATRDNSHLYHLFVAEAYQGRGYATLLWQQAQKTLYCPCRHPTVYCECLPLCGKFVPAFWFCCNSRAAGESWYC